MLPTRISIQLDKICRKLESQQKHYQQHNEYFVGRVTEIKASAELLVIPDFYTFLIPFCFQFNISLLITKENASHVGDKNTVRENIRMMRLLGVSVFNYEDTPPSH